MTRWGPAGPAARACASPRGCSARPERKFNLVCLAVTKLGGGSEVKFPGHWLTKSGLEERLENKMRTERRKEGPFQMAKACRSF